MDPWLLAALIAAGAVLLVFVIYLILIAPGKKNGIEKYKKVKFAHRGLHGEGRAENSLSAFAAATEEGYGIELDVRLSKDGELVVFHDDTLDRVVGIKGRVEEYTAEELGEMSLSGTKDGVPKFSEVLKTVGGRVPLLIEIKEMPGNSEVSAATVEALKEYDGPYVIESFNPLSLRTVARKSPKVARGILSHRYYAYEQYKKPLYFLLQCLLLDRICRPAFIAYDHRHAKCLSLRLARMMGAVTYAWTVRSPEEEKEAYKNGFDSIIFENYRPEK
jgi:glycerophosphoryl diester phosphodiesterase